MTPAPDSRSLCVMSRVSRSIGSVCIVAVTIVCLWRPGIGWSGTASSLSVARADDRYTPLVMSVFSPPRWFKGVDGRFHLVYELKLTNGFPVPVTVRSVSVIDATRRVTLQRLSGARLVTSMSLLSLPDRPTVTVPPSAVGVVWFEAVVRSRRNLPSSIVHKLTVALPPGLPVPTTITHRGGYARIDLRPPVVLGPPLAGAGWIALGSCCDGPHRRSIQPVNGTLYLGQRFAIDWNGMDAQHRFAVGNPDVNTSWVFYGKPVLAVANAKVVAAVDRFPDQIPNHQKPVTLKQADGNYVILALGHGRFAFYAHLKPRSVRVRRGERVRRGQVIARLGNSGSSSGPHLHFQVMDRPSALASDGLPFVFNHFRFDGRIPPLDASLLANINDGRPVPIDRARAGHRLDEFPLGRDVLTFARH
jgi:peptidase M23-like protein